MKNNKILITALIVAAILLAVAGIYLIKTLGRNDASPQNSAAPDPSASAGVHELPLERTSIDISELVSHGQPVMINFGSEGCPLCVQMRPYVKAMYEEMYGKVVIVYIDVWENKIPKEFPVRAIPTQMFINADGTPFIPNEQLEAEINAKFSISVDKEGNPTYTVHEGFLNSDQMRKIFAAMEAAQ